MKIVTAAEMREIELRCAELGLPGPALMEIAGRSVADVIVREFEPLAGRRALVLVGPGNNGCDGLVAARHLSDFGARVFVYRTLRAESDDAKLQLVRARGVPVLDSADDPDLRALRLLLDDADVVVDALLGTGRARPAAGILKEILEAVNGRDRRRSRLVAVDLPTGLDADTGQADPSCLVAGLTVTLGRPKRGLFLPPGLERAGRVVVGDIGLPPDLDGSSSVELTTDELAGSLLPARPLGAHKGTFGKALVVAGSADYVGAPALAATAAIRIGAGLVTVAPPRGVQAMVAANLREPTWLPLPDEDGGLAADAAEPLLAAAAGYDTVLVGPGLGRRPGTAEFVRRVIERSRSVAGPRWVVDADGLNLLSEIEGWSRLLPEGSVLTPHPGEMARLAGPATSDRISFAREKADEWRMVVVLKGACTVVAAPDGRVAVNPFATPALSTAGTGDVLAGTILGLLAQGLDGLSAAVLGTYLHGLAGEALSRDFGLSGGGASDLAARLPGSVRRLRGR
jgi:NAD(P)H-hydrate epimerase